MNTIELKRALEMLPAIPGLELSVRPGGHANNRGETGAQVHASYCGHTASYHVHYSGDLSTTTVNLLALRQAKDDATKQPLLVYAPCVSVTCGERLRDLGIGFVDDLGHAFLRVGDLYLFILGRVKRDALASRMSAGVPALRGLKNTTLRLIYSFLADPMLDSAPGKALLNQTYRKINHATGIALGAISNGIEDLMVSEYLVEESPGNRLLINRRKLFERWVQDYGTRMRPKLVVGHYRAPATSWWQHVDLTSWGGLWGGEVAGARLTHFLTPETAAIYADSLPDFFLLENDLRKDPAGRVEVLRPFWRQRSAGSMQGCVHPLVVYADLAASDVDRNLETATRVYEQYLRKTIESA